MYLETITEGLMRGLNLQMNSLWYNVMDSAIRIALVLLLVPQKGIYGFLFVMLVSNIFTSILNLYKLLKVSLVHFEWTNWLFLPAIAVITGSAVVTFIKHTVLAGIPILVQLVLGAAVLSLIYFCSLICMGCITKSELRALVPLQNAMTQLPDKTN